MKLPLTLKLKKAGHKEIARAQDIIVEELYKVFDQAVLHGGTAIWRCYGGNRFSEDVDVYLPKNKEKLEILFQNLGKRGLAIAKKKITEKSVYSRMTFNRIEVRFEATFKKIEGRLGDYELADGNAVVVYTLLPEELIKEKISAYTQRLKIRDLYDIFFLLKEVKEKEKIEKNLKELVKEWKKPTDEKELQVLIIEGLVLPWEKMLEYIQNWLK